MIRKFPSTQHYRQNVILFHETIALSANFSCQYFPLIFHRHFFFLTFPALFKESTIIYYDGSIIYNLLYPSSQWTAWYSLIQSIS
jgi:hypothetical protein